MTLQVSTGLKKLFMAPFVRAFSGGAIAVYGGARPATADVAAPTAPLAWITHNGYPWVPGSLGAGLGFLQDGPLVVNDPAQEWLCAPITAGTATWWRLFSASPAENFATNYDLARVDGDVGTIGTGSPAELQIHNTGLLVGQVVPVTYFLYTVPPIL